MNIKSVFFTLLTLAALPLAQATPIDITVSGGNSVTAAPKSDLGNFGDATVYNWLASDISAYNTLNGTTLPGPVSLTGQTGLGGGAGGNSITLDVTGFDYLFFHWGGQGGGWAQAFYVGGSSGTYTFYNTDIGTNPKVGGLSFYSLFNERLVPDGGSTILMFGTALGGLGILVRRFRF